MNKCFTYVDRSDNWETPRDILNYFFNNGYIDFNPLSVNYSNSLLKPYNKYFCNPPFSNIEPFIDYMIKCSKLYNCVLLLPIRLNTNWFIKLVKNGCSIIVIGRLKYSGKDFAPFDSMLVFLAPEDQEKQCFLSFDRQFKNRDLSKNIQLSIFDI